MPKDELEKLKLQVISDQEQEWTEGREWFRSSDRNHIKHLFDLLNEGTTESVYQMTAQEISVVCNLAKLSLIEIAAREDLEIST